MVKEMLLNDFTFEEPDDDYIRKPIAKKICRLLKLGKNVSPMVIDGNWGSGKSVFCYKFINLLKSEEGFELTGNNYQTIYIDAFKADHADEPLMTLMAGILQNAPETDKPTLKDKAMPVVRAMAKMVGKAGLRWVLKQDFAQVESDFKVDLQENCEAAMNYSVESLLKDHMETEKNIATFKDALAELAKNKPILIFVDELDRCRPDFAVNMLENIKHIFDVEGVQFILVANMNQLRASIGHCYGVAINKQQYLDKFLKFSFVLPDTFEDGSESYHASEERFFLKIEQSELLSGLYFANGKKGEFIKTLISASQLTLRQIDTFIRYLEIYQSLTNKDGFSKDMTVFNFLFRLMAVYIAAFEPAKAHAIFKGNLKPEMVAEIFGKEGLFPIDQGIPPEWEDLLIYMIAQETRTITGEYGLSDQSKEKWNSYIKAKELNYFIFDHNQGFASLTIFKVIKVLKLA